MSTLQFETPSPMLQLQYASESLSGFMTSGISAAGNFTNRLLGAMPDILSGFRSTKGSLDQPQEVVSQIREMNLGREQVKFLRIVKDVPYSDLRGLDAFVPAGMQVGYMEALGALQPATEYCMSVRGRVIEPFMMLLAKLVSDKQGTVTTTNYSQVYKKLNEHRELLINRAADQFAKNNQEVKTTVGKVIDRNSDWPGVLHGIANCSANLEAIDLKGIQKQLAQCSDYLEMLHTRLKEDKGDTSREAAQGLADGAYSVAQEMQFISATYFRSLQLTKSIDDTIAVITGSLG